MAQIKIDNPVEYQKYLEKTDAVFKKFNGEYLALDNHSIVLEEKWNYT